MSPEYPVGVVTLVFTDIQGYSEMSEKYRLAFQPVLQEHNRLLREVAARWHGIEVKTQGDEFFLVFDTASDAVEFAVEAQRALQQCDWQRFHPEVREIRVRMGIHTGEPLYSREGGGLPDYFGPAVNRASRVMAAGHGGQILISNATHELVQHEISPPITFSDLGVHRLKGVGEERFWQVRHPELPAEFPPLVTLNYRKHNLPLPYTPFVGREQEIRTWCDLLLEPRTRLMTLVGFGGMGKTRAALQIAELCVEAFEDGVWWVDLEEARTGHGLIQRIAYQLNLHLQPQPSVKEQLFGYLRDRKLLLVLDNTEQIPDAADVVSEMLDAAPGIRCLVTSRRALDLRSERQVQVQPLPLTDSERLFLERARARRPDFEVTPDNRKDVTELCRSLEGVPLAVELAASRIGVMTPREILDRLDERFRVLQTRAPDMPPRQRALRVTIDWSYDLLTEEDKALFAQLSVFSGGFLLPDAEAICEAADVFEGVLELQRHSLLRAETDAATQKTRFLMLISVRDYAAEKLKDLPDIEAQVRRRHAAHYLRFAEERATKMRTRSEAKALDELGSEFDNVRAAMYWARDNHQGEQCMRLALALFGLLYRRGFWAEARRCLQAAEEAAQWAEGDVRALRASVALCLASVAEDMGELEEARRQAEASLALCRELGNQTGIAEALNMMGLIALKGGDVEAAQPLIEEALRLHLPDNHSGRGRALHNLALLAARRRATEEAQQLYAEALTHRRRAGDARGEAETLNNLGVLAHNAGRYEEARRLYHEGLALHRALRNPFGIAIMLNNLAEIAETDGDVERAITLYCHARRIFHELQSAEERTPAVALERLARQLGTEQYAALLSKTEGARWEEMV